VAFSGGVEIRDEAKESMADCEETSTQMISDLLWLRDKLISLAADSIFNRSDFTSSRVPPRIPSSK
jgi:hypothetical protein